MKTINTPQRLVLALAAAGVLGAAGAGAYTSARASGQPAPVTTPMVAPIAAPDFSTITARNGPAVVNISVTGITKTASADGAAGIPGMDPNDPFYEFFQQFRGPNMPKAPQREVPTRGQGSGFIISPDGTILTNAHVVKDAKEVTVKLTDRREFRAKVLGSDPKTDIAVLKIDAKNLPTVPIGNVKDLKVGEWVLAIGSPFGFENTVTAGVVSAKGRSLPDDSYTPFIQTDVPINPGNSGGPLFNLAGEVVGINSQIYTRSGGFMGVSFAIPIDVAMDVSNQLKTGGKVSRGWLGVVIQEVNKDLAESFGLEKPAGALVAQIQDDGPAAKGGLQVGDVILSLNGQPIVMSADLPHLVGALKAGAKANLEVIRDGKRKNVELTVGAIPEEDKDLSMLPKSGVERSSNRLGVAVVELNDEQKKAFDLKGGVVIKEVQDGPAALIGLQPGDVITHLNNQAITSAKEFTEIAKALPKNRSVSMRVLRQGRASFITFKLAE